MYLDELIWGHNLRVGNDYFKMPAEMVLEHGAPQLWARSDTQNLRAGPPSITLGDVQGLEQ